MRILYGIPRYAAGLMGNRIHVEIIEHWRAHGVDTEVLTLTAGLKQAVTEDVEGITVHRLPVNRTLLEKAINEAARPLIHYPYWLGALAHYRGFMRRHAGRFDLIHLETAFPLGALGALASVSRQPPMAVTLPGADVMAEPDFDYGYGRFRAIRVLLRRVFRRAALLRADSPMIARLVIGMGADPRKTVAIPFNITDADFPPAGEPLAEWRARARAAVCARHGLDPRRPLILSISRLHPFKGVEFLVEALPALRESVGPVQAILAGPSRSTPRFGDYATYLRRRAGELGVSEMAHLIGAVDHTMVPQYYAASDIVVVPSVVEALNRVAVEAGAAGTPTVVTRTTGISEWIVEHGSGQVVEPRSGHAIATAAIELLRDHELWERQSANGPGLAAEFRSGVIARRLLDVYRPIVATSPRA